MSTDADLDLRLTPAIVHRILVVEDDAETAAFLKTLLEREILDGNEVMAIINGQQLPPLPSSGSRDSEDHTQQVLRPETGRRAPGFNEGERPQPA